MQLEPYCEYQIQFTDSQTLIAKFIREEQQSNEIRPRCKFVIGKSITIRVHRSEFKIIKKTAESAG